MNGYVDPDDADYWQHLIVLLGWVFVVIALTGTN